MREASIERRCVQAIEALDWAHVKVGFQGWPDRLVMWAPGRHFWWEAKTEIGSLTPAQRVRIPRMRAAGETVFLGDLGPLLEVLA